jgi:hypothetical protein
MADVTAVPLPPDHNRGPEILAVCGGFVALALVAVLLRIWIRAFMVKSLGADDYVMIGAMVSVAYLRSRFASI